MICENKPFLSRIQNTFMDGFQILQGSSMSLDIEEYGKRNFEILCFLMPKPGSPTALDNKNMFCLLICSLSHCNACLAPIPDPKITEQSKIVSSLDLVNQNWRYKKLRHI